MKSTFDLSFLVQKNSIKKFRNYLGLTLLVLGGLGCQEKTVPTNSVSESSSLQPLLKEKWHWDQPAGQNETAGYAQVVKAGNTLYISGVPAEAINEDGISRLYQTLGECLKAFGATPENVVKETLYTTDIEAMKANNDARKAFYNGDYPAASWVQISRLYEPNARVEVDLIAVLP